MATSVRVGNGAVLSWLLRIGLDAPFWLLALVALGAQFLYQKQWPYQVADWSGVLTRTLFHTILYRLLYWLVTCRFSPWRLAWLWLGSPLLLFAAVWLHPAWAVVCTSCWAAALWWSVRQQPADPVAPAGAVGCAVLLAWVSVCGAGGYGFQSPDYVMHNGRLLDLIHFSWPVSYANPGGGSQLLVQYAGYYLWPALAGKLAGEPVAMLVQHLWLLMGCWLALRMLLALTGVRRSWLAAAGLVLFGGWDIAGLLLHSAYRDFFSLTQTDTRPILLMLQTTGMPEWLDFWPATEMQPGIWFGNFISLASSMLWAPHQIVAGWVLVGLLCQAGRQQRVVACLFACALLAYWSPMIVLGLAPMVLVLVLWQLLHGGWPLRDTPSVLAGVLVLGVLGVYYASASANTQPYGVLLFTSIDRLVFVLFVLQSWGLYAMLVVLHRRWLDRHMLVFACAVFTSSAVLSCVYYGVYNDLLVRASAALFYGMLLVMATILRSLWQAGAYWRAVLLVVLLLPGACSGVLNVWQAVSLVHTRVPGMSVVDYPGGWQFLGKQDSWFVRYLSADSRTQE